MTIREEIELKRQIIADICQRQGVTKLYVFGSATRDDFNPETSDIDFLVEFSKAAELPWAGEYEELRVALERTFDRRVDIASLHARRNPYLQASIDEDRQLLYAA